MARGLLDLGWSAGAVAFVRLSIAAIVVAPFAAAGLRGHRHVFRSRLGSVIVYGAVPIALTQFAYLSAVARMDAGPALLIEYTAPVVVVLWLWLRRAERPSRLTLVGALAYAIGLLLVLDLIGGRSLDLVGVGWALLAMVGAASYFFLGAGELADIPPVGLAGAGLVVSALVLGLLGTVGVLPMHAGVGSPRYAGVAVAWWLSLLVLGAVTAGVAYCAGIGASAPCARTHAMAIWATVRPPASAIGRSASTSRKWCPMCPAAKVDVDVGGAQPGE